MEICLPGELEDKLSHLASRQGRDTSDLVVEAVVRLVDHDLWFTSEVEKGLAQIDSGQTLSHDEVGTRLRHLLMSKPPQS